MVFFRLVCDVGVIICESCIGEIFEGEGRNVVVFDFKERKFCIGSSCLWGGCEGIGVDDGGF